MKVMWKWWVEFLWWTIHSLGRYTVVVLMRVWEAGFLIFWRWDYKLTAPLWRALWRFLWCLTIYHILTVLTCFLLLGILRDHFLKCVPKDTHSRRRKLMNDSSNGQSSLGNTWSPGCSLRFEQSVCIFNALGSWAVENLNNCTAEYMELPQLKYGVFSFTPPNTHIHTHCTATHFLRPASQAPIWEPAIEGTCASKEWLD